MSCFATIEQIHTQCRIDVSDAADDALLLLEAEAASEIVLGYTGQTEASLYEAFGRVPAAFTVAVLLMVGDYYANREAGRPANVGTVSDGVAHLLNPYMMSDR